MAIRFPDFRDTQCVAIGACGELVTDEKDVLAAIDELKDEILVDVNDEIPRFDEHLSYGCPDERIDPARFEILEEPGIT